ncbi:MAG: HAD-IA family hydrolase [Clostridia bacterium]|nr:HAD-IA family hydrolase [Clostridia bacterium]
MKYDIEAVIFDFDGVIVDSGADIVNAVQYTLRQFKQPELPYNEIIGYVGHGAKELIRKSFKGCSEQMIEEAFPVYKNYYLEHAIVETKLYLNVKETLTALKDRKKKIALVTNKPEDLALKILKGLEVEEYFDSVIGPESVKKMKPDPEGILKVVREFGVKTELAVMVGDSHTDVEAGRSAGTITCGVTYGLGDRDELVKSAPNFFIDEMSKLIEYIE